MTEAAAPSRCRRCRRVLADPRWVPVGLGRVCAGRLGLVLAPKPRVRRPRSNPVGEHQPVLFHLPQEEINGEIEDEDSERSWST